MHPRIFLQRLSDQPRASVPGDPVSQPLPLGFVDPAPGGTPTPEPRRNPIGFGPPEPRFVTEVSFRRTEPARVVPSASSIPFDGSLLGSPIPGLVRSTETLSDIADDQAAPTAPKKVPFYKRELSLRRRKAAPVLAASANDPSDVVEPVEEPEHREVGYVHPSELSSDAAEHGPEPENHDEPVELPLAEADAADEAPSIEEPVSGDDEVDEPDVIWATDVAPEQPVVADELEVEVELDAEVEASGDEEPQEELSPDTVDETPSEPAPTSEAQKPKKRGRGSIRARKGSGPAPKRASGRGGRKVVGLKVGASQLAAAVVSSSGDHFDLLQLARRPLAEGVIGDGEVRDPEALTHALKAFFADNKLPRRDVRIGIASNRIGVRTLDIVGIDDDARFDNAVRFKAHEVLPVSVQESVLDYRVIDERVSESGEVVRRVLLVVAPRDQVEPFVAACRGAGIRLTGVDLEALGLLRTFVEPHPFALRTASDTATVVVSIGHEATTLLVAGGGSPEFTRVFDWGGGVLQHAIAQELDVHPADATTILKGLSLSGPGRTTLDEAMRQSALDAVRARLTPFARELVSSLQFYQTQPESLGIGEIVITGGTSHLEGLGEALHQMIGVAVRVGNPLARVVVRGPIDDAVETTIGSMSVPIGLAIEDESLRTVNLLPPELRQTGRRKPSPLAIALPAAAAVPFAALGLVFMQASDQASEKQAQLATVQAQYAALPEPTVPEIDAGLEIAQQQRAAALASVLGSRLAWDRVLGDLSRVLPANVWLTKFTATSPDPAAIAASAPTDALPGAAPGPTGVTLEGYTYALPDVARLLARLSTVPSLTNVVLGTSARQKIGKREAVSFTILADLDNSGGAK